MKRILAHSVSDAQKRRDAFEERYNAYIGRGYDLDEIKRDANKRLECKYLRFYLGESYKFRNEPNPIVSFSDGKLQFTEQGLRAALKKKGADPELLKMDVAEMPFDEDVYYASLYFKRKDVMKQVCTITYDCIQMEIKRTYVEGSPFSHYTIIPAKEMWVNCNVIFESNLFNLTEQEFYFLDLATLLMDLALEYRLRQEEIAYHAKRMRILTMDTAVLDEEQIPLEPIDDATIESVIAECGNKGLNGDNTFKAIVQPWMDAISNYFVVMSNKYDDRFSLKDFEIEPRVSKFVPLYNTVVRVGWPKKTVTEFCEGKEVVGEIAIIGGRLLSNPSREQAIAYFKVGDAEMIMDEMIYCSCGLKNTLTIFPNATAKLQPLFDKMPAKNLDNLYDIMRNKIECEEGRFRLDIKGSIGIHALVGYLKQMPALCEKMDELAARIDKMLEKQC